MHAPARDTPRPTLDVGAVRRDFPILSRRVNGRPLVYLDNGATTQKPRAVIDALVSFYAEHNANVHRGVHTLSQEATAMFDDARLTVAEFVNAPEPAECLFVRGVTEAINLVAMCWARVNLKEGDEILLTALEHHSNIVPWQLAAEAVGARVKTLPMNERGELEYDRLGEFVTAKTKLVAMQHVSNALGTIHDVRRVVAAAREVGAVTLIDGAQHVGHRPTDVQSLGCDFYCFSGHKLFGPTGVGVLWGRREILEQMPPFMGGGDMIESVTWEQTTYAAIPAKFEAGTPDISGAIGLAAAMKYVQSLRVGRHHLARGGVAGPRDAAAFASAGPADHRHGGGQRGRGQLRARRPAGEFARHWHEARRTGHCGADGASLCATPDGRLWHPRHDPRELRVLQHA